ncbi:tripartite tricarboxylate transporter substrate binding protein [Candidimonas nitroreducens]|uniref:LacI family transcriptional regulator n=1 Tax=Candidimonas nitroreducens TaxID=683354 RepID=A0A225MFX0_9BURK|nr:tripartite tricarboxylate transporter substrate binding protein [Candidimonas nitroreducens]OWT60088.1 hypothetical protein CEY11_10450 [Candidimonas nitroreducens]
MKQTELLHQNNAQRRIAMRRRRLGAVAIAAALSLMSAASWADSPAQDFPNRAIKILVPFTPGGGVDTTARIVAEGMSEVLQQSVIVENKPGGSTNIAAELVAKSPPDGYTLFAASRSNAINPSLFKRLPFDIEKDFAPISVLVQIPNILVVNPKVPAHSVRELIALAKKEPGKLTFASAGVGSSTHMAGELFKHMTGTDILHVPYKGGTASMTDLISGRVTMYFATMPSAMGNIKSGKLRALAVTSLKRSTIAPEYPTLDELGLKGYQEVSWIGLMAPAATPKAVVDKLSAAVVQVLHTPKYEKLLKGQGAEIVASSQQQFAEFLHQDIANTRNLIESAHVKLQ